MKQNVNVSKLCPDLAYKLSIKVVFQHQDNLIVVCLSSRPQGFAPAAIIPQSDSMDVEVEGNKPLHVIKYLLNGNDSFGGDFHQVKSLEEIHELMEHKRNNKDFLFLDDIFKNILRTIKPEPEATTTSSYKP